MANELEYVHAVLTHRNFGQLQFDHGQESYGIVMIYVITRTNRVIKGGVGKHLFKKPEALNEAFKSILEKMG